MCIQLKNLKKKGEKMLLEKEVKKTPLKIYLNQN